VGLQVREVLADNGVCHIARVFASPCAVPGICRRRTRPYTPAAPTARLSASTSVIYGNTLTRECIRVLGITGLSSPAARLLEKNA
jgi:hypothetical protein